MGDTKCNLFICWSGLHLYCAQQVARQHSDSRNILVFAERRDGEIRRPALEAVSTAYRLAQASGGKVDVVALGPGAAGCADTLAAHGASRLFAIEADHAELYAPELYAACVAGFSLCRGNLIQFCLESILFLYFVGAPD